LLIIEKLLQFLVPLRVIAKELTAIRELYEMEQNDKGFHRVTEEPSEDDTEVIYEAQPKRKSWLGEAD
jgi:hypothetical protein